MEQLITCREVNKEFKNYKLEDISFDLPSGYILGVIGRNGCGKTTLLRILAGQYRISGKGVKDGSGKVIVYGQSMEKNQVDFKNQVAYVSTRMTYASNIKIAEVGELYGHYYKDFDLDKFNKMIIEYGIVNDMKEAIQKSVSDISTGQRIKLQIVFSLCYEAKLYIFDEPAGNLDVEFRDEFYKMLRDIVADGDKSVIYASHLVVELEECSDYILWLGKDEAKGSQKFYGTIDELKDSYQLVEADEEEMKAIDQDMIVGGRRRENHTEYLVRLDKKLPDELKSKARYASLKEIMYYEEKGEVI